MHLFPPNNFIYPNETELQWSILIVLYPFHYRPGGGRVHSRLARARVPCRSRQADLSARACSRRLPSCWSRRCRLQLHLGHPERSLEMYLTPHTFLRDGDVRLRLSLVSDGRAAARNLARLPARYRAAFALEQGLPPPDLQSHDARLGQHQRAIPSASTSASATSSPSSEFLRPSCCTATSGSFSDPSKPTPGGPARSCPSSSFSRPWYPESPP